jgi:hypothetical protein
VDEKRAILEKAATRNLDLDDVVLGELAEAWPHVATMLARIERSLGHDVEPASVFTSDVPAES